MFLYFVLKVQTVQKHFLMKRKNYPTIDGAVQAKSNGKL